MCMCCCNLPRLELLWWQQRRGRFRLIGPELASVFSFSNYFTFKNMSCNSCNCKRSELRENSFLNCSGHRGSIPRNQAFEDEPFQRFRRFFLSFFVGRFREGTSVFPRQRSAAKFTFVSHEERSDGHPSWHRTAGVAMRDTVAAEDNRSVSYTCCAQSCTVLQSVLCCLHCSAQQAVGFSRIV